MSTSDDERWMRRALRLASRAEGETNPNPLVGCVIVKSGRVVGEGYHRRAGGPHAEVEALERAGGRARGGTLYVNLEPCSHQGRTPACAPQVAHAGLRRVVVAIRDPNPRVDGQGLVLLRRRGIETSTGTLAGAAALLNEHFIGAARNGRPFVLLKAATTLDGRIATASGDSKWITSPSQRRAARGLRRTCDAVLVGIGTALADDPTLLPTPRVQRPFVRIVLDSRLRLPPEGRLARGARRSPVWVVCRRPVAARRRALEARGVRVLQAPAGRGRIPLLWLLRRLEREGLASLMVEGGSEVLGEFLAHRLFDKLALFRAPLLLGGRDSRSAFGGPDPRRIGEALELSPASPLLRRYGSAGLAPRAAADPCCEVWYPVEQGR